MLGGVDKEGIWKGGTGCWVFEGDKGVWCGVWFGS